jgi:hypothetical protein
MPRKWRLIILTMGLFTTTQSSAATFSTEHWYGRRFHMNLVGQINSGDDDIFKGEMLAQIRQGHIVSALQLYTPGGDVDAAISIGEQARLLQIQTVAPFKDGNGHFCRYGQFDQIDRNQDDSCDCESACFIIWAAGIDRKGTYVGIHHPYFSKDMYRTLTPERAEEMYTGMANDVRKYLTKMDVPDAIVGKMFRYISTEMYFLDDEELDSLKNPLPWAEQLMADRCGTLPDGTIFDNSERKQVVDCQGEILEAIYARGEQKYLDLYGNRERVPDTEIVTTTVPGPDTTPGSIPSTTITRTQPTIPPAPNLPMAPAPSPVVIPTVPGRTVITDGPNTNYIIRNNRDLDGVDIKPYIRGVDQNACAQACADNNVCQAFSFDEWNHFCILKTDVSSSRLEPREISGVARSIYSRFPSAVDDTPHFQKFENAYFRGDSYSSLPAADAKACLQICDGDLRCVAYTYLYNTQTCRFFNSTNQYVHGNVDAEAGVKTQSKDR